MHGETVLTIGSLFSGIGGLELGLEATGGFKTIWNCEIEPYPSAVLAERWPGIPNLGDITKADWSQVKRPDVLCGGFPCQDISQAGKRAGIAGKKSGLWKEYLRAIRSLRPRYAIIENVAALVGRGLDVVLADLAALGYDAEWDIISAADVGAPHLRKRIFIVAYLRDADSRHVHWEPEIDATEGGKQTLSLCRGPEVSDRERARRKGQRLRGNASPRSRHSTAHQGWEAEPAVGRMVDGISSRLDLYIWRERIRALGNAVVPQVAERVGRAILRREKMT